MTATDPNSRIDGLDTLRALAIALVMLHHYVVFVTGDEAFGWLGEIGWTGVDLFFALSGYLIGNQIFAALLWAALGRSLRGAWCGIALVFAAGMLVRGYVWIDAVGGAPHWRNHYYKYIYYSTLCRLDELVAGVALALLKNHHPEAWRRVTAHGNLMFAGGCLVTALAFWLFLRDHFGFRVTVFGYPLLALGFSMLIVAALSPVSLLRTARVPGAASLALWSYAIYLTHKQVCVLAGDQLRALGYSPESPAAIALLLALSVLSGWLLYKLVETPFMALRERYVPTTFARAATLTPAPR